MGFFLRQMNQNVKEWLIGYLGTLKNGKGTRIIFFLNLLTPTKKRFNPDFGMTLCLGWRELSFGVLFGAFRRTRVEQNNFQKFWGSI